MHTAEPHTVKVAKHDASWVLVPGTVITALDGYSTSPISQRQSVLSAGFVYAPYVPMYSSIANIRSVTPLWVVIGITESEFEVELHLFCCLTGALKLFYLKDTFSCKIMIGFDAHLSYR